MDLVFRLGQRVPDTKVNGNRTKLVDKESFGTQMATFTMDNGNMTRQMDMAHTSTLTGLNTKDTGKTI